MLQLLVAPSRACFSTTEKLPAIFIQSIYSVFFSAFYKSGNYIAAINAFTAAIVLDGSIPSYPFICYCIVNFFSPRQAKTGPFFILPCLTPDYFTCPGRAPGWERVKVISDYITIHVIQCHILCLFFLLDTPNFYLL